MRNTKEIFINNLKRGRASKRLTQEQFAVAVDMSLRGYQKFDLSPRASRSAKSPPAPPTSGLRLLALLG